MSESADRRSILSSARDELLNEGTLHVSDVPDHVAASWRRSASRGVEPHTLATEQSTDLDTETRLVRCAQPVIEQLSEQIAGAPFCIALTDEKARILTRHDSNSWIARMLDRVYFAQGFDYTEGAVGTNGVGTVLEFGESVHIVGAEHFVDTLQSFACAGAPVRDPFTGRIAGVLDMSCLSDHSTPLMHSLVRSSARQIEANLLLDRDRTQQALFDAYSRADVHTRSSVLAVGHRVVMANTATQTLLAGDDREAVVDHVRFVMARRASVDDRMDLPSGRRIRLRGSTIHAGLDLAGMVVVVSPLLEVDHVSSGGRRPRHPRAPGPARRGTADAPTLCPAWRTAAAGVERALGEGRSVLVLGEPGSGRLGLVEHAVERLECPGPVVAVGPDELVADPEALAGRLRRPGRDVEWTVLRDVDQVPLDAVRAFAAAVESGDGPPPALVATGGDGIVTSVRDHPLLPLFTVSVTVPALRHRLTDLPAIACSILAELAPHRDVRLSPGALRALTVFSWPGNIGQLEQALAGAVARRPVGEIEASDLPAFCHSEPRGRLRRIDQIERDAIVAALQEAGGNRVVAATRLGVARSTLYRKIKQFGLTV